MSDDTNDPLKASDSLYRSQIDRFGAYLSIKESDSLIEGFFASGHLLEILRRSEPREDVVIGLTGSIGRREAHRKHSDYDIAVIAKSKKARDSAVKELIERNPGANFERAELFDSAEIQDPETEKTKDDYYPLISTDKKLFKSDALFHRVWLLTEFTPLHTNDLYRRVQKELIDHYKLFRHHSLYAEPQILLKDLLAYPGIFAKSLERTASSEENEQPGLRTHAKTIMLRKFAHLFTVLSVLRTICRKYSIMTIGDEVARNDQIFLSLRAPTIIQLGYWFSDEFHFDKPMRRFDSETQLSSSIEVFDRYLDFLKGESNKESPGGRGKVILKLCESVGKERGLVRRLFKRTSVELIENYNEGLKRIWDGHVREYLATRKQSPAQLLKPEAEFDNIVELAMRVLWPLNALANLLSITFEVAGEWGYFEGETYPGSGRAVATRCLVDEVRKMLGDSKTKL